MFSHPSKTYVTISRPQTSPWNKENSDWRSKSAGTIPQVYTRGKAAFHGRQIQYTQEEDVSWDPELDKEDISLSTSRAEKKRYAREEQRTIIVRNLSDRMTHKDIIDIVRGGVLLDVFLRSNEHTASISFVEGSAAQNFMNHVKRNDVYVHGRRVCIM